MKDVKQPDTFHRDSEGSPSSRQGLVQGVDSREAYTLASADRTRWIGRYTSCRPCTSLSSDQSKGRWDRRTSGWKARV